METANLIVLVSCFVLLGCAFLLALLRLLKGPDLTDRVLGLDLMGMILIAVLALLSLYRTSSVSLDVALTAALVLFLGTVSLALFLRPSGGDDA